MFIDWNAFVETGFDAVAGGAMVTWNFRRLAAMFRLSMIFTG